MGFRKKTLYWLAQATGWMLFILLLLAIAFFSNKPIDTDFVLNLLTIYILGIGLSHLLRLLIVKLEWFNLPVLSIIPRVLLAAIVYAVIFHFLQSAVSQILISGMPYEFDSLDLLLKTINYTLILILWTALYFLFHFIQNYRKEEIKNLQWQAKRNEIELNQLKSQLNPHFIFNSMNSIRALIEENPNEAKTAVTRLANILRNSLMLGSKQFITLKEELNLVKDYLNLEKTRFEDRLIIDFQIDDSILNVLVPPMMVQTLVENAIKHGISKLPEGGKVTIKAIDKTEDVEIIITNPGSYKENKSKGFGIINTRQRLAILYKNNATFNIKNVEDSKVQTTVIIPKTYESSYHR
ncbi:MAG: histidine kinase [Vicingaceae bacterium]